MSQCLPPDAVNTLRLKWSRSQTVGNAALISLRGRADARSKWSAPAPTPNPSAPLGQETSITASQRQRGAGVSAPPRAGAGDQRESRTSQGHSVSLVNGGKRNNNDAHGYYHRVILRVCAVVCGKHLAHRLGVTSPLSFLGLCF